MKLNSRIIYGLFWIVLGSIATYVGYSMSDGGGTYLVFWGAIAYGAIQLVLGLAGSDFPSEDENQAAASRAEVEFNKGQIVDEDNYRSIERTADYEAWCDELNSQLKSNGSASTHRTFDPRAIDYAVKHSMSPRDFLSQDIKQKTKHGLY